MLRYYLEPLSAATSIGAAFDALRDAEEVLVCVRSCCEKKRKKGFFLLLNERIYINVAFQEDKYKRRDGAQRLLSNPAALELGLGVSSNSSSSISSSGSNAHHPAVDSQAKLGRRGGVRARFSAGRIALSLLTLVAASLFVYFLAKSSLNFD